jgi:hypothetical protein
MNWSPEPFRLHRNGGSDLDAFSLRDPVPTSHENAPIRLQNLT